MMNLPRQLLFHLVLLSGMLTTALPVLSAELPLSVSPPIASPGQTITVTGTGFQPGAKGLVWGGGLFLEGGVVTGSPATGVSIADGYAYVVGDDGLKVIDISNPAIPVVVGSVETPNPAWGVTIADGYAYVTADSSGLQIIDISNPATPVIVGSVVTPAYTRGSVRVSNGYAYVADTAYGIQVIDISNPAAPVLLRRAGIQGTARGVSLKGNYLYVAIGNLQILDISNPAVPVVVGSVATPDDAWGVSVADGYAYVADGFSGLQVVDISDPSAPIIVGSVDTPNFATAVSVAGGYAFVADGAFGLQVIDIRNPEAPKIVGNGPATCSLCVDTVITADGYAYVANGRRLDVINISSPVSAGIVGSALTSSPLYASLSNRLSIVDGYAYIASNDKGLQVIDISNPLAPALASSVDTPGSSYDVSVTEGYAFVADAANGLQVIDISNPLVPVLVSSVDTPGTALGVSIASGYAFVADSSSGLQVIDISNPLAPVLVSSVDTPGSARKVSVSNGYAYVADGYSGLEVIDISNPSSPVIVGNLYVTGYPYANYVRIFDNFAYLAASSIGAGLYIIDISIPSAPVLVGSIGTPGSDDVSIANGYAYTADTRSGLSVVDISNPAAPVIVNRIDTPAEAHGVSVANGYIYVSDNGLWVLTDAVALQTTWQDSGVITFRAPSHLPPSTYDVTVLNPDGALYKAHNALTITASPVVQPTPHFVFGAIASPQAENQTFAVSIATVNAQGTPLGFSGNVSLSSDAGPVSPTNVTITNGVWSGNVTIYGAGVDVHLHAAAAGGTGDSAPFELSGQTQAQGRLRGRVVDHQDQLLNATDVYLDKDGDGTAEYTTVTDSSGNFVFPPVTPGHYSVWAEYGNSPRAESTVQKTYLSANGVQFAKLKINTYSGKTPVLLVPGILESTIPVWWLYPKLTSTYPASADDLVIHDPLSLAGWKSLRQQLVSQGYLDTDIVDVPYDWRMPVSEAANYYLKAAIDEVKKRTGSPQVDIVAHSTGGLLARSYIQGVDYDGDIRKFAMVGTPNEGAVNMYYIWAGGNPKWTDDENDAIGDYWVNYYWNSIENLYSTHKKGSNLNKKDNIKIWNFLHSSEYGPIRLGAEGHDLMPTFPYLKYQGQDRPVTSTGDDGNTNSTLIDMNSNQNRSVRMSPDGNQGTVETKVFYSESEQTIKSHSIVNPDYIHLYEGLWRDGKRDIYAATVRDVGDGTVLKSSATFPATDGWANMEQIPNSTHSKLIKNGKVLIANYLSSPIGVQTAQSVAASTTIRLAQQTTTSVTSVLSIGVVGRVRPYLQNPTGLASGVNTSSGDIVEGIPGAELTLKADIGGVRVENPDNGIYSVSVSGYAQEEVAITLSYSGDTASMEQRFWLFHHGGTSSFTFQLDAGVSNPLIETYQPQRPSLLIADAIDSNGVATTSLTWQASPSPGVSGYKVYGRRDDEPFLNQIGMSTGTTFDTGDLWAGINDTPARIYAVSAVLSDGTESFLSEFVENNDRDHDGLTDSDEANVGTNPLLADSDLDGLNDNQEMSLGTNPLLADSDGDGVNDGDEIAAGTDPLDNTSFPVARDGDLNADGMVNAADVLLAERILTNQLTPSQDQLDHGDVAPLIGGVPVPDGLFDLGDVLVIQRKALGLVNF